MNNAFFIPKLNKILILFILFFLVSILMITENIDDQLENILTKINPNNDSLNWTNVKNDFELLVNRFQYLINNECNIEEDSPIWIMWYQGIENAPPLIKSCIQSINENKLKHPLYIITKYNFEKFVKLPNYILEKFYNGTFSITHFSDIMRFALLSKYGGYWIDSTFFITNPLTKVKGTYYTLKLETCFTYTHPFIKCLWGGNFMAVGKKSFIATYCYIAFLYYWKKYNSLIDYFLIDYIIHIAYINSKKFKDKIANLPLVTCNIFQLANLLNSDYKESDFECSFNKLNRRNYHVFNGNNITNYGYIINKYKIDMSALNT